MSKREVLGGHFDAILGVGGICENRCFMKAPAQLRGFWRVQKSTIFETFSEGVNSAPLGGTFGDFDAFWAPIGIPWGPLLAPFWRFLREPIFH